MVECGAILYIYTNITMVVNLIGTYDCKADSKGRVMIPKPLKSQLEINKSKDFVIKRSVFNNCLEMYPIQEWEVMIQQVNKLNRFVKKHNDFIRSYMSGLRELRLDSTGRFLIPKDLVVFAGIDNDVVLASSVNMIEIWDKFKYENAVQETLLNFGSLAEEVMGDIPRKDD